MREKKRKRKTLVQATETEVLKEMDVSKLNDEKRKKATAARKAGISQETYSRRTNNMKKEKRKELFLIMLLHI